MLTNHAAPIHRTLLIFTALAATMTLVLVYLPGLQGPFLFDDFANLPSLGTYGPVRSWDIFLRYITSGHADPTGRPIALLSFLIDARNWPADPLPFKRSNLILHGINAVLLGLALAWIGRLQGIQRDRAHLAGALAAAFWALHPFLVSTVLYVVQREAMLPATFTLLGMLCWLQARRVATTRPSASLRWIVLGVGSCTALAVLSKANGLLLPLLVLVCESTLPTPAAGFRRRITVVLAPVAVAVIALVTWTALTNVGNGPIPIRGWTITQRLMTEPSILFDYLSQLWLIEPTDSSLLHDGIPVARSLLDPWYTTASILGCLALIGAGIALRRRFPALAMAMLFFFAGHLMESTSLALELYFDHRNYLPAMPMFWPIALAVTRIRSRWVLGTTVAGAFFLLGTLTVGQTTLWGNAQTQGSAWADLHPESARAQAFAAQTAANAGFSGLARRRIDDAAPRFTGEPQIALNVVDIHCLTGGVQRTDIQYVEAAFRQAQREPGPLLLSWFNVAINKIAKGQCPGLEIADLTRLLDAASANAKIESIPGRRQDIEHARGLIEIAQGSPESAAQYFRQSLSEDPNPATALSQAAILGSAGRPALGLSHLQYFASLPSAPRHRPSDGMPWVHDKVLEHQHYWENEISHLSETLARDARKAE